MKFEQLNKEIPYIFKGKEKSIEFQAYPNVKLLFPGRHKDQTTPIGGDFCVVINDPMFREDHQFKHTDIFDDVERRKYSSSIRLDDIMIYYLNIIAYDHDIPDLGDHGITAMSPTTFLQAVQCLAIAEHRRYAQHELKYGGRYLPFRFAAGISEGLWNAEEASWLERKGRPGVEQLERERGIPQLTQELFDGI